MTEEEILKTIKSYSTKYMGGFEAIEKKNYSELANDIFEEIKKDTGSYSEIKNSLKDQLKHQTKPKFQTCNLLKFNQ